MKYLPIHSSSSIWLRDDNLWTNLNQFCVNISANIMELIVFITHIWLYGRFYISEFTCFSSFPPTSVAFLGHVSRKSCCDWVATANDGGHWRILGTNFIALIGHNFYCTLPRQFILHLHRYNILRSPRGTQFWVSRSKKCLVRKWQYLVFFRYFLTTYIIPFLSADVLKKYDKKRLFIFSLFLFSF